MSVSNAADLVTPSSQEISGNKFSNVKYNSLKPSRETLQSATNFKEGDVWRVDNNNYEAALLAAEGDRQPCGLRLISRYDAREAVPVAAISKAIKRCGVTSRSIDERSEPKCLCDAFFYDTFYTATDVTTDNKRVESLLDNPSLELGLFIGHLDSSTIAKLRDSYAAVRAWCQPPFDSYGLLGLAIGSAADAAAVSALGHPCLPIFLHVSVTARVGVEDLKPLPGGVAHYSLHFPFLTDSRVDTVRPAIEALCPKLRLWSLYFPKIQLTSPGLFSLIKQLRGVEIDDSITVEVSDTWQPDGEEMENVVDEFLDTIGCSRVKWHIKYWSF